MGFSFTIGSTSMYFTYNFGKFRDYWDIRKDLFGHTIECALQRIERTLQLLSSLGYTMGVVDEDNHSWAWGKTTDGEPMQTDEFMGVFMYSLNEIAQQCKIEIDNGFGDDIIDDDDNSCSFSE
jgi:hypothetical protein